MAVDQYGDLVGELQESFRFYETGIYYETVCYFNFRLHHFA